MADCESETTDNTESRLKGLRQFFDVVTTRACLRVLDDSWSLQAMSGRSTRSRDSAVVFVAGDVAVGIHCSELVAVGIVGIAGVRPNDAATSMRSPIHPCCWWSPSFRA
jgi:hypothetical protein